VRRAAGTKDQGIYATTGRRETGGIGLRRAKNG